MKTCPDCGSVLDLVTDGAVPVLWFVQQLPGDHLEVRMTSLPFYACTGCEFCELIETRTT